MDSTNLKETEFQPIPHNSTNTENKPSNENSAGPNPHWLRIDSNGLKQQSFKWVLHKLSKTENSLQIETKQVQTMPQPSSKIALTTMTNSKHL